MTEPIEWDHLKILYEIDKLQPATNRLCPKLNDCHIFIKNNNFLKIRVSLATQVSFLKTFQFF